MGQYYMAYVRNDEGERVYNPNTAVYMAKNGIRSAKEMGAPSWGDRGPDSWMSNFSGLKLMEHSWVGNSFVDGVMNAISDKPSTVAWVGDYACEEEDFVGDYTPEVYDLIWESDSESPFDGLNWHRNGFLVNASKGIYLDMAKYTENSRMFTPKGKAITIHPLPILTAIGNGRGGGDYDGNNMDLVGSWAMDTIKFTLFEPSDLEEVDYVRYSFTGGRIWSY